jgi:recombinational DNA repair protein RecT
MAKKCAIRRLCKTLPLTIEAQEAIAADDQRNNVIDVESQPTMPSRSASATKLDKALGIDKPKETETFGVEPEDGDTLDDDGKD